ncbi:MAG TPA: 2-isopropylmalate synthase [Burkholderiales bacterium]|nr:2-isopropylmalate synthase [Burkholderiales bacterium]
MLDNPAAKYRPAKQVGLTDRRWPNQVITKPPIWCSVDLRDGNQALIEPMNIERKHKFFKLLCDIGVKEIEAGFPSASQIDFDFLRQLIEGRMIPEDVTIQVLTPAREDLITRTFESLKGAPRVIMHVYHAVAPVMRRVVFNMEKAEVISELAVKHARIIKALAKKAPETRWIFQYSPEMFSNTELDFSKEACEAVMDVYEPSPSNKMILNLPSTVECSTANVFADQLEWFHRNVKNRDSLILSVHPHNDRGTGTAAAEFAIMAGMDRVEGCLFGNGERTGNVDLVNLALNMYSQGVNPGLNFSDIDSIRATVEYCNQIPVHPRHPYVGDLVYTSFSGSHQDAIKKAFGARKEGEIWDMPYLPIDPKDVGRSYEAVIRVNAQSGKGGISFLLQSEYGLDLPRRLQIEFSQAVQKVSDATGKEQTADDLWNIFDAEYLQQEGKYAYVAHQLTEDTRARNAVHIKVDVKIDGVAQTIEGNGNGPIDAFIHALGQNVALVDYHEHAIGSGSNASAVSYIELRLGQERPLHGVGIDPNIITASLKAVLSGLNRIMARNEQSQEAVTS